MSERLLKNVRLCSLVWGLILSVCIVDISVAVEPNLKSLEVSYTREIQPILKSYCHECHSGKLIEAELDLSTFKEFAQVRKDPKSLAKNQRDAR